MKKLLKKIDDNLLKEMKQHMIYDPISGNFLALKKGRKGRKIGDILGWDSHRYRLIYFKNQAYRAHRLAWLFYYNQDCEIIDHIDLDRSNNKINNLRNGSRTDNNQNIIHKRKHNTTGKLGVEWSHNSSKNLYTARITAYGKRIYLGAFSNIDDAHQAYVNAKQKLHPFSTLTL